MAYRRPGVQVTQEFADLLPALAAFNLPNCVIGDAYQVVSEDELGDYEGIPVSYSYSSLNPGNIVDTRYLSESELSDHQYPITVKLIDAKIEQVQERESGAIDENNLLLFSDATVDAFADVIEGDEIEILERTISIVGLQTNGSVDLGSLDTLTAGVAGQFADVLVGDAVEISGGTGVTANPYTVAVKIDDDNLQLNAAFGSATTADVTYEINRTTGTTNQGLYQIKEVTDVNNVELLIPLAESEGPLAYRVLRKIDEIPLERDTHYDADETSIDILSALQLEGKDIVEATTLADYRALRIDLQNDVREYKSLTDLQAVFGVDQIVPANPLAFGLAIALQNTVTAVNGLGLGSEFFSNDTLAYQKSLDVLKKTEMYALCPLTQAPVVHQLYSTHVTQMSFPDKKRERVALINRTIITEETIVDSETTSAFRIIVNTQTDGIVVLGSSTLSAPVDTYDNIQVGDIVSIVGGTGVATGDYVVESVDNATQITLGDGFVASGNGADVQYFIRRDDGIEANGEKLYDGNAGFLTGGVSPGYFVVIEAGNFQGRYKILSVDSDKQVTIEQVPGVVSVQAPITYRVEKDLTNSEIADFIAGYASAFGNRRLVLTFPDVVKIPEGSILRELPGFYLGCALGGLTTGLPTQQGFTNITVSGFLGFVNGSDRFDEDQLDQIADGGVMIFDQEVAEAPLYIRHELTTDRSAIKFQEYMVTKNVDFIAKFMRNAFKDFIGVYNIYDGTFDELKATSKAVLTFLQENTSLPRIGGVIKSGKLEKLEEGVNIDTIDMRFKLDIPIPLNNIDITIQV
jgi:hypothetical protein